MCFRDKYWFLSNFYPCIIMFGELIYPTVEHAYQAAKTCDNNERKWVQKSSTPGEAKRRGKLVKIVDNWNEQKLRVMELLLRLKFKDEDLRRKLLDTGDVELVEDNWWGDKFWGVYGGEGENHLGKLLMKIREELKV